MCKKQNLGLIIMKKRFSFLIFAVGITVIFSVFCVFGRANEQNSSREFLAEYGWETENKPKEIAEITVPEEFDAVYENYNKIQNEAGLDLLPYRGKEGKRYTYVVTNYPLDVGETVYANVICIDGVPVAGDIMTVSLQGFMHSLKPPVG